MLLTKIEYYSILTTFSIPLIFLTFLIRFIPMSGVINFQGSTLYTKVINLIPIVVLTPIIIQALMFDKSGEIINSISFEIACGVLAVLISILFKILIEFLLKHRPRLRNSMY